MVIKCISYVIGDLVRTIYIRTHDWGIYVSVKDRTCNQVNARFQSRNFRKTTNYKTIEDNIKRAMKHYNAPQQAIDAALKYYEFINNK